MSKCHFVLDINILHSLDDDTKQILDNSKSTSEIINRLLRVIISLNQLKTKEEIIKNMPFSMRVFEELIRAEKIPHLKINNKTRLFNQLEIVDYLDKTYKIGA